MRRWCYYHHGCACAYHRGFAHDDDGMFVSVALWLVLLPNVVFCFECQMLFSVLSVGNGKRVGV